jgi:putative membrane protein
MKRRAVEKLRKAKDEDFDRDFVRKVGLDDHKDDIKSFEKASKKVKDPELRAFAEKTLPTLKQHLAEAQKLPEAAKQSRKGGSDAAGAMSGSGTGNAAGGAMGGTAGSAAGTAGGGTK